MAQKQLRPPALDTRNGLGNAKLTSSCKPEFSACTHSEQAGFAIDMIARRFRVSHATALANAEAFGLACLS